MSALVPDEFTHLFDNPELDRALDQNPFTPIMEKFAGRSRTFTPEQLDELVIELQGSAALRGIEAALAEVPRYTGLYRYDVFSIGSRTTFAGEEAIPPRHAWFRVFEDLTFDDISVVRTDDEAMVVINHPAFVSSSEAAQQVIVEPTILFTSRILQKSSLSDGTHELNVAGLQLKYAQDTQAITPEPSLRNPYVMGDYYDYVLSQYKNKQA